MLAPALKRADVAGALDRRRIECSLEAGFSASLFALAAFSYAATGATSTFSGASEQAFPPLAEVPAALQNTYTELLEGIHALNPGQVTLHGELQVNPGGPDVTVLVGITYFAFSDGRVTSFIGYRDPLVLVSGGKEVTTTPEVLSVN